MSIAIVVHGGAGTIATDRAEASKAGCREAALIGWGILQQGGSALDAVEAAVRSLEDNPNYNAGTGSSLSSEGRIEMDAGMMDGEQLNVGAVAGVQLIKHPITLARKVLTSPHVLLIDQGAQQFALEHGMTLCKLEDLLTERQYESWKKLHGAQTLREGEQEPRYHRIEVGTVNTPEDLAKRANEPTIHRFEIGSTSRRDEQEHEEKHGTVGAVAVDAQGRLAAATSTGGIPNKHPGRVGDSPLVGSGFYADEQAAVSCTGYGEDFIRLLMAKRAADFVAQGMTAREAAQAAIAVLSNKAQGKGGLIIVDHFGNAGFAWNSNHMAYAYMVDNGMPEPIAGV